MVYYSNVVRRFFNAWPGKRYLAEYRFLPIFFFGGAAIEYLMIHWTAGGGEVNFYKTYKKRKVNEIIEQREKSSLIDSGLVTLRIPH